VRKNNMLRGAKVAGLLCAAGIALANGPATTPDTLEISVDQQSRAARLTSFDGVIEAVRQTVLAAQEAGAVTLLNVKVGDTVKTGQLLVRIDAQAAMQTVAVSDAQVPTARAALDLASKDSEREKQLHQKNYISQAALQRAEAHFKSAQAHLDTLIVQAGATRKPR
jgi:membrane fusion protein, multidrug efflux system